MSARSNSSCAPAPLLRGPFFLENEVVPGVVIKLYAVLYPHTLVCYRKESRFKDGDKDGDRKPSKAWPLADCSVSPVHGRDCLVRGPRRMHLILALTTGKIKQHRLNGFKLSWGASMHLNAVTIYFDSEDTAHRWQNALIALTDARAAPGPDSISRTLQDSQSGLRSAASAQVGAVAYRSSSAHFDRPPSAAVAVSLQGDGVAPVANGGPLHDPASTSNPLRRRGCSLEEGGSRDQDSSYRTPSTSLTGEVWLEPMAQPQVQSSASLHEQPPGQSQELPHRSVTQRWEKMKHHNGVAVYFEGEGEGGVHGSGGAMMVSAAVRSTPTAVFKALTEAGGPSHSFGNVFADGALLEKGPDNLDVLRLTFTPGGWLGSLSAARDLVVARTWRREDDGTYILLYQSVEHPAAPPATVPVRGKVQAAGITIAPLMPACLPGGERSVGVTESPECLVTQVTKVDAGGWLSPCCWLGRSVPHSVRLSWAEPFVLSVITLRDRVEQERFVVQPLLLVDEDGMQPDERGKSTTLTLINYTQTSFFKPRTMLDGGSSALRDEQPGGLPTAGKIRKLESDEHDSTTAAASLNSSEGRAPIMSHAKSAATASAKGVAGAGQVAGWEQWVQGTLDASKWSCPGSAGFRVRGPQYLKDRRKVAAEAPVFALASCDLLRFKAPARDVAPLLPYMRISPAPFSFVLNIMVPGPPYLSLIMLWAADTQPEALGHLSCSSPMGSMRDTGSISLLEDSDVEAEELGPFDTSLARFLAGDDAARNGYFKLIPRIVQGSWVIKQSVGSTPVILGRKLKCSYYRGTLDGGSASYVEVDVDVASSSVAAHVVGLVQGATRGLVVDLGVLLEGHTLDELPEALLGTVRFSYVDMKSYKWMDTMTGEIYEQGKEPAALHE